MKYAVAKAQPAGQVPVLEPLQAPQAGTKPNYSKNIQNNPDHVTAPSQEGQVVNSGPDIFPPSFMEAHSHTLFWVVGIAVVVVVIFGILWKKKIIQISSDKSTPLKSILALAGISVTMLFAGFGVPTAKAQSAPVDGPAIQRTIVEEGVDGGLNPQPNAVEKESNSKVIYALGAIALLAIALGAGSVMWANQPKKPSK